MPAKEFFVYECISLDGAKSAFIEVDSNLRIFQLAQRLAREQGILNFTSNEYVIADAYTGLPYTADQYLPITRIPEFSSIRLMPIGATIGNYYKLKRFSVVYFAWSVFQGLLLFLAVFRIPVSLFEGMPLGTWISILVMLSITQITALIGFFKSESTFVVDPSSDTKRLEALGKQRYTLIALGSIVASLACAASFQLGLGNWISVVRGTVVGIVVTIIVAVASAFGNRD